MIATTVTAASFVQGFLYFVGVFFVLYLIGYSTFLFLSVTVGSSILYRRKREAHYKSTLEVDCYVPITIIVPAHNESVTVESSLRSLLNLDYTLYEVIVVDDGSTDDTAQVVVDAFGLHPIERPIRRQVPCAPELGVWYGRVGRVPVTLISKENGGKADALNMGINASQYPYFICIDADSVLQYDSLREVSAPLVEHENVVAVGGLVRISNGIRIKDGRLTNYSLPKKIIPAMQVLEYDRSFLSARILFDQFNGNLIISGAFGLFRKDLAIACGGYDLDTVGEDMELVTKLHVFCRTNPRLPDKVRTRRHLLEPGARDPARPRAAAPPLAHGPVRDHDEALAHVRQPALRAGELLLVHVLPDLRAALAGHRAVRAAHGGAGRGIQLHQHPVHAHVLRHLRGVRGGDVAHGVLLARADPRPQALAARRGEGAPAVALRGDGAAVRPGHHSYVRAAGLP